MDIGSGYIYVDTSYNVYVYTVIVSYTVPYRHRRRGIKERYGV